MFLNLWVDVGYPRVNFNTNTYRIFCEYPTFMQLWVDFFARAHILNPQVSAPVYKTADIQHQGEATC